MSGETTPEIGTTVIAGGIATNCLIEGEGAPVLMIHGSGPGVTAYANWRLIIPNLARDFRVIAPDIVGFGHTERPADFVYDLDGWTGHLLGLLDALGLERAHIVGNSFGGALAVAMADRHPDRVDQLVLMGSVGVSFPITPGLDKVWGYEPSVAAMADVMSVFATHPERLPPELIESRYQASVRPGYQECFAAMFAAPRQARLDALATPEDRIASIAARALIVHGRDDKVIPLDAGLRLHRLIADSDMHIFGQCGHWPQIERADQFSDLVRAFLQRD